MMAPAASTKTESLASSSSTSSVSSLSSASGNALSTLTKAELDRLIAENMAAVLKTLKKRKHAKKHARMRQAAVTAMEITQAVEETNTLTEEANELPNGNEKVIQGQKKELNIIRRRISPRKSKVKKIAESESNPVPPKNSSTALQPKTKEESCERQVPSDSHDGSQNGEKNGKENKTINAFQLMMGARSKTIGSNSPGKDLEEVESNLNQHHDAREERAKRKLQLEQWAERKGSGKRKLQEEAEEEYIEHQLKKRAKRLKKLIGNMVAEDAGAQRNTPNGDATAEEKKSGRKQNKPSSAVSSRQLSQSKQAAKCDLAFENGSNAKVPDAAIEKKNSVVQEICIEDSNDEFLKQLSSPRKKKDSLLGYFAKVPADVDRKDGIPSTQTKEPSEEVAPRVSTPTATNDVGKESVIDCSSTPPSGISSRPRRSCANRIKDYAAFERYSPEKVSPRKSAAIVTPLKIINVKSSNTMKVVKSPSLRMFRSLNASPGGNGNVANGDISTTPKSVKLAPVFSRATKQQSVVDPEKARARQLFLMSGIPEKMRLEMEKRAAYEEYVLNESPVFPLVSHVTQLVGEATAGSASASIDLARSRIRLRPVQHDSAPERGTAKNAKERKIRFGMFTACDVDDYEEALIKCIESDDRKQPELNDELPEIENVKEIVRDYKQRYQHFPVFKCYKQFRSIYRDYELLQRGQVDGDHGSNENELCEDREHDALSINGQAQVKKNGFNRNPSYNLLDDSVEFVEPINRSRNGELLFTEKYKPQHTGQILLNYVPATVLRRFLSLWQDDATGGGPRRPHNAGMGDGTGPDDDDFEHSSGSSSGGGSGGDICNHVVLVGPPGCGKTCNVYAVAQEMNFNVLEINASSRRKGKIILQELLEATQSHRVRQKTERSNSTDSLTTSRQKAGGGAAGGSKKLAALLNGGFSCLERRPSFSEMNGNGSKKLSLILIEDADIVFEQDDGFLGAINQLVATSKRPIVLTTTNPSCPHMARYMTRNNVIRYVAPGTANVAKFLSLLALVERIPIDQYDLGRLYAHNGKDMRKTLNEVQFFIQSGGDMLARCPPSGESVGVRVLDDAASADLNETTAEECGELDGDGSSQTACSAGTVDRSVATHKLSVSQWKQHTTLYQLFTRNQNEEMVLRLPLAFDTLWCNMELVLREAKAALEREAASQKKQPLALASPGGKTKRGGTPKRQKRRNTTAGMLPPDMTLCDDLGFLYENISRAEMGSGFTLRNRERFGRELQDDQQQQQMASEMGHALVEGSWIDWFERRRTPNGTAAEEATHQDGSVEERDGAKAYDGLRKLEEDQRLRFRQTIASYIGVNGIRSRVTACEVEPVLRQICRTERKRSSQDRRGSRFYHYFRNFNFASNNTPTVSSFHVNGSAASDITGGFSLDHFDALSKRFEEQRSRTSETKVGLLPEKEENELANDK